MKRQTLLLCVLYLAFPIASFASAGESLPWEAPLTTLMKSITGPVALSISTIAMGAAGGALIFGGELSDFTRKIIMLIFAIALMVSGSGILTKLFGVSGALI